MCTTTVANNARFALPSDVVQYIEKSLTKKEMKKKTIGRKSINYPKRSEIIKIGPVEDLPEISEKENIESNSKNVSFNLDDYARAGTTKFSSPWPEESNQNYSLTVQNVIKSMKARWFRKIISKLTIFYIAQSVLIENEKSLKDHVILMH